ncbi:MAG: TonB-dependent receptor plug domain-containing protein [Janthinobacterium lividum]
MNKTLACRNFLALLWAIASFCGFASFLVTTPALAQIETDSLSSVSPSVSKKATSEDTELLLSDEPVVFTASKTLQRISDSPAAVTVITAEQIRNSGATTIPELLRSVPGVDVIEPNQSLVSVSIRGFDQVFANKVLVMVDGRTINQPIEGAVFWDTEPILLSRIARIEIVRGPGSVLYGADAFSGVINIITKTPQEMAETKGKEGDEAAGTLVGAVGEQKSTFSEATYSQGKANDWAFTLGAGYHSTAGFGGSHSDHIYDSAHVPTFTADLQKQLSHGSLLLSASNSDAKADFTALQNLQDASTHTNSLSLTYSGDQEKNPVTARVYSSFFRLSGSGVYAATSSNTLEVQQQRRLSAENTLIYGGDYRQDHFAASLTSPQKQHQQLSGLYLQDQYQLGPTTSLFAGLRWDQNSVYGSQVSPRLSLIHHLPHDQTVRLSYGTAFRAPTIVETYLSLIEPVSADLNLTVSGSTDIKPEKIASLEAGYRVDVRGGYVGLNLFYNRISDIIAVNPIQFAPSPPFPVGTPTALQYQNDGTAHEAGLELETGFQITAGWHGLANYAFQDVRNGDGQPTNLSPKHKVNLSVESDAKRRWTAYTALHFVSASRYFAASLRAYTTVDGRFGYRVGSTAQPWTISLAATNLLNDHHREYSDLLAQGTSSAVTAPLSRTLWLIVSSKL